MDYELSLGNVANIFLSINGGCFVSFNRYFKIQISWIKSNSCVVWGVVQPR